MTEIKRAWKTIIDSAELLDFRIHDIRHSFASLLASSGASLPLINRLLGDTQPQTTARYAHLLDDPLRQAVNQQFHRDWYRLSYRKKLGTQRFPASPL